VPGNPDNEFGSLIQSLADASSSVREKAAGEIFERGVDLALPEASRWLQDEALAGHFLMGSLQFPEVTVGVAVSPSNFDLIRSVCGSPPLADVPPDQDAREFELDFPNRVRLDILTTRQPEGAGTIARYLQKFGESIQQVELLAKDVDQTTQLLLARFGLRPVFPKTRAGANGTRVNFFLVPAPGGGKVLIELVEAPASARTLC
jgi:hypothetical protein